MRSLGSSRELLRGGDDEADAEAAIVNLAETDSMPTAIFAFNDLVAAGALSTLEAAGLRVPDDVSVVGYDNTFIAELNHMSLTTVNQPRHQMGQLAIRTVLERIEDDRTDPPVSTSHRPCRCGGRRRRPERPDMTGRIRIGIVGTSWWADSMYLPALRRLDGVDVPAVLGRNPDRTSTFAREWEIPAAFTDTTEFFEQPLDAVVIASANDSHHPLSIQAIERGLDVLCEKPLGLDVAQAQEMTRAATAAGAITLVPFTYRYMPVNQYLKRLIDEGYLGEAFHLGLRYFTGFARHGEYAWRFDRSEAGSGVIGDIGSHFLHLARWFFGEVSSVGCLSRSFIERPTDPTVAPTSAVRTRR